MLFGSWVWTTAMEENGKHVFKLQKIAACAILDADFSEKSAVLFGQLDWLPAIKG